jgi:hypothetical protein
MTTARNSLELRPALIGASLLAIVLAGCSPSPSPSSAPIELPTASPVAIATVPPSPSFAESPSTSPSPSPTLLPAGFAPLDGLRISSPNATRLPLAIMIDDNAVARPQAGFNAASIVYQAPADGGEDRYMLIFQEGDTPTIGPVRSGRPYFVRWAAEYRAAFGHYGGDAKTLAYLPTVDGSLVYNIDALSGASAAYHRITTRPAPHNAYTSTAAFRTYATNHGAPETFVAGTDVRPFIDDAASDLRPATGSIKIPYSTGTTGYTYDRPSNTYLRSVAGRPQIDAADGKRVVASDVVVLFMKLSIDPQSEPGHRRPVLAQIGSGKALVFRNGTVVIGTWRKADAGGLTRFFDPAGVEVPLVRGRIFIQVVATGTAVSYVAAK